MSRLVLLLLAVMVAGCGATGTQLTEEARCRQFGGMWRATYCDQGGGGGGGY
jgi:hypothetical protein